MRTAQNRSAQSIETEVIFCGLSKNNLETLKENIDFITLFEQKSKFNNISLLLIDSNSNDGSKEFLNKISQKNKFTYVIHKDDINSVSSRIERIKICRNLCLQFIQKKFKKNSLVYIPFDTDFYLFSKTSFSQLDHLISKVLEMNNNSAIFPASVPYYYDIFALRAPGWLSINSQLIVSRLKKYLRLGSFFYNYLFIFRYQITPKEIESKNFSLISAFGGIGIYNISNLNLKNKKYQIHNRFREWYSEHLYFNQHFDILEIDTNWNVEAPREHIMFKTYDLKNKSKYVFKSLIEDIKNILKKRD